MLARLPSWQQPRCLSDTATDGCGRTGGLRELADDLGPARWEQEWALVDTYVDVNSTCLDVGVGEPSIREMVSP